MLDTAYVVKSILPRASVGSFKHFVDIYFSTSVCISVCGGRVVYMYILLTAKFPLSHKFFLPPWQLAS